MEEDLMNFLKKMLQVALAVFFFALLATNTVLADDADSEGWQFVQENGRTYYKKGDLKETYWRVIDGKYYYFDPLSGEMVVGWQYIPFPSKGSTIGPYPNGIRLEGFPKSEWYYFDKNGVLQEFVGWKALEIKTKDSVGRKYGEKRTNPEDKEEKSFYTYYLDAENGDMKTGWQYLGNKWYYLRSSGAMATGWVKDGSTWYYLNASNGDMKTGWTKVNGNWYYLNSNGAMVTGSQTIDGKVYNFGSSGEWI